MVVACELHVLHVLPDVVPPLVPPVVPVVPALVPPVPEVVPPEPEVVPPVVPVLPPVVLPPRTRLLHAAAHGVAHTEQLQSAAALYSACAVGVAMSKQFI
jgi:hypothetical protein